MIKLPMAAIDSIVTTARQARAAIMVSKTDRTGELRRSCGTCTECCDCLSIETSPELGCTDVETVEFAKGPATKCEHADKGCTIYAKRPISCRGYACLWVMGWGKDKQRPDKTGVLIDDYMDAAPLMLMMELVGPIPVCFATECRPGVFPPKDPRNKKELYPKIVRDLADERVVMLRWYGDTHPEIMLGPDRFMRAMRYVDQEWVRRGM